jgi:hypothetical protein
MKGTITRDERCAAGNSGKCQIGGWKEKETIILPAGKFLTPLDKLRDLLFKKCGKTLTFV